MNVQWGGRSDIKFGEEEKNLFVNNNNNNYTNRSGLLRSNQKEYLKDRTPQLLYLPNIQ